MNEQTTRMLLFLAGALCGGTIAGLACQRYFELHAEEEIASVKLHYGKMAEARAARENARVQEEAAKMAADVITKSEGYSHDEYEAEDEVEDLPRVVYDPDLAEEIDEVDLNVPHVIDLSTFAEHDGRPKVSLIYYEGDDILADSDDQPIQNALKLLGQTLTYLDEKDTIYVRNPDMGVDYEVVLNEKSYAEAVAGIRTRNTKRIPKMRDED